MFIITGMHSSLVKVRKKGLEKGMKNPTMMPMTSIKIIKLVPHRGWNRRCLRTFSTVRGRSAS